MGEHNVRRDVEPSVLREFTNHLMRDVRALELMLHEDMFETGVRRIGAEQELFMVNERGEPAPVIEQVLEQNTDERIVTELTKFNVEFNMDPLQYGDDCFAQMEAATSELIEEVRELTRQVDSEVAMTGILPTANLSDFALDYMTPRPRYYALNDALSRLRGGPGQYQIQGIDELFVKHDSIMLEGCNTSFQTHFQVAPEEFPRYYNIAQVVAAPCLAAATNSPLLFGKRLWRETRIALFQQAVDTRSSNLYLREMSPRVHFGTRWVEESVAEIFKEDISRFRVLLTAEEAEDPFEAMRDGRVPSLQALQLHNGTVYRWNRACYGIYEGKPHLRIENRILPSGPSTIDEVANAAFWFGLVSKLASEYGDIRDVMEFDDAKSNFIAAARLGLGAQITWTNGKQRSADELIAEKLLPMARAGLEDSGVAQSDVDRYIGVLEERVETKQTGAQWMLDSDTAMKKEGATRDERLRAIVAATVARQKEGRPGHEWELAQLSEAKGVRRMRSTRVEHYMTTDLFTVHEDELVEFVACLMDWQHLRHVLVEDEQHRLIGIVSHRSVLRYLAEFGPSKEDEDGVAVSEIMVSDPASIGPDTSTIDAVDLMRRREIGALPVVRDDQLVGIVTGRELMQVARRIMDEDNLREDGG